MSELSAPGAASVCGRFTLLRRIGVGGMGEIFLAEDSDGTRVAIKRLLRECAKDPVFIGMFLDEARLVERLSHPNICDVYEHGQDRDHYYLVMEHIDGISLRELLERRGLRGLAFPLACRAIAEVSAGLDYAHRLADELGVPLGVVHRDVSPANIMIGRDGSVKIVDFGLAKARTQLMKTQPGLVKGKFGYLAPEQLGGRVDWRTDLFALGLCFYEALTGQQLFDQRTAAETVQAIGGFTGPPRLAPRIPGAPDSLDAVLAKVLSPSPDKRYESAAAFRAALGRVVVESGHGAVSAAALASEVASLMGAPEHPPALSTDASPAADAASDALEPGAPASRRWLLISAGAAAIAVTGLLAWLFL